MSGNYVPGTNASCANYSVSDPVEVTIQCSITPTIKIETMLHSFFYPNPVKDMVYFSGFVHIAEVYDLLGSKVHQGSGGAFSLDFLPKGLYYWRFIRKDGSVVEDKFIKD